MKTRSELLRRARALVREARRVAPENPPLAARLRVRAEALALRAAMRAEERATGTSAATS